MKIFETSNYQKIHEACDQALISRAKVICIIGDRGQGRTIALTQYCKIHSDVGRYSEFKQGLSPIAFIKSLISVPQSNHEYDLTIQLINQYQNSGCRLLVIDSFAPGLLNFCLQVTESLHDITLVISCTKSVFGSLKRKQNVDAAIKKILYRSTVARGLVTIDPPRKDEVRGFCTEYGINEQIKVETLIREVKSFRHLQFQISKILEITS